MQRAARHTAGPPLPFLINKKEFSIMEQTICVNAPLALAGTRNTRELGGYPAACGRKTRRHAFLRSDGLSGLTDKDVQMLLDYGVCCVVDLRSESETAAAPSRLADVPGVDYYSIPMLDEAASQGKEVFAVPANADCENAAGGLALIMDGAVPVTCGWDVLCGFAGRFSGLHLAP